MVRLTQKEEEKKSEIARAGQSTDSHNVEDMRIVDYRGCSTAPEYCAVVIPFIAALADGVSPFAPVASRIADASVT